MNNPTNTQFCQIPPSLRTGNKSYSNYLLAGVALIIASADLPQLDAAISVPSGTNLTTYLERATAMDYAFELSGNVNMTSTFNINSSRYHKIDVNGAYGNGLLATITRSNSGVNFAVTRDGSAISIKNAEIRQSSGSGGSGAIYVSGDATTIDLDNTTFIGNTSGDTLGFGSAISVVSDTDTTIKGNVSFMQNKGTGQAGGAVGVYGAAAHTRSTATFTGETVFIGNSTGYYGGAVAVNYWADVTFEEKAIFRGNYATLYYGGALDLYGGDSHATFKKDAEFTGNYVKNTSNQSYGVRGGAVNVGWITGSDTPHLDFQAVATFTDNYVWGTGTTKAYGGAMSMISGETNPDTNKPPSGREYEAIITQGIFENNIAYSENANAYGGAIYTKTVNNVLTLGSGSSFTNNYAKTEGGAIYFDQGTLNLNGNVVFKGNRHAASFDTSSGRPVYVAGSGKANAIYFGVSSNTAKLNLNAGAGEVIHFADPIESASDKTVTVTKIGAGTVLFTEHSSDILAKTSVAEGTFELGAGASYGRIGAATVSSFNLSSNATLKGGNGATLRAGAFDLAGRIEVSSGQFTFSGGDLALQATTIVALAIESLNDYSSINLDGKSLNLNGASLEITATNYVPSQNVSDIFTIVSNIGGEPIGTFLQGDSIVINGAQFSINYDAGNITLSQTSVPEPTTYAIGLAAIAGVFVIVRRRRAAACRKVA